MQTIPERADAPPDEARWAQVKANDPAADGTFVYAVLTTGIYCRPSCPSRIPKRDNVRFYADPAAAEDAGYRACKRCRPQQDAATESRAQAIARVCRHLDASDHVPTVATLAELAGMAPSTFHRAFKAETGVTPRAYATASERSRIVDALERNPQIGDAMFDAGFRSSGRFDERTEDLSGMTPSAWKHGGRDVWAVSVSAGSRLRRLLRARLRQARRRRDRDRGVTVRFAVGDCSLGCVLVGCTERGIAIIDLGDSAQALVHALQDRLPKATLVGADPAFERYVARVVTLVEDPCTGLQLPLDVRGTAFQQRVWQALRDIPPGETRSYAEVALAIGRPTAARAIATACAANPVAIAIPCHRVVRSDGALSGYRWGVERKRELLLREERNRWTR